MYIREVKDAKRLRRELPSKSSKEFDQVGEVIRKNNLESIIFQAVTGYEAIEEITRKGTNDKPGYSDCLDLAYLLSGRKMGLRETKEYFIYLAEKYNLPLLTEERRAYVENFGVEYVRQTPADELKAKIPIFAKPVRKPENYAPFLRELHEKVKVDKVLQYEFLKKWTGITKEEQITYAGEGDIPGFSKLKSLCAFFTGRVMKEKEVGRYLKWLMRTEGGTINPQNLTDIIMDFGKNTKPSYAAKILLQYTSKMTPEEVRKELPLHPTKEMEEVSQKLRKLKLEYLIFIAATGYEYLSDLKLSGSGDKLGYNSFTALAHLLSGRKKSIPETGGYFRYLAKKHNMPLSPS